MGKRAQVKRNKDAPEIVLNVQANQVQNWMIDMLQHLYTGAYQNQLSLMEALEPETNERKLLLVWNEFDASTGKIGAIPIAKMFLKHDEWKDLKAPDGHGGWIGSEHSG